MMGSRVETIRFVFFLCLVTACCVQRIQVIFVLSATNIQRVQRVWKVSGLNIIWNRQSLEANVEFFLHSLLTLPITCSQLYTVLANYTVVHVSAAQLMILTQFPVTSAWIRYQRSNNVNHD